MLGIWGECITEIFEDHRKNYNLMKHNFAGPPIIKDKFRAAMRKIKSGKATGPDRISVELLEALEDNKCYLHL